MSFHPEAKNSLIWTFGYLMSNKDTPSGYWFSPWRQLYTGFGYPNFMQDSPSGYWLSPRRNFIWGFGYPNFMQDSPSAQWFSPRKQLNMGFRLSEFDAGSSFGLLVFTPKQYRLIAVNLWNSHHRRRWDSSEGWTLIVRPTLLSLLIAIAFIHSSHTTIFASCCIALHRNGELKMPRLKQKVL